MMPLHSAFKRTSVKTAEGWALDRPSDALFSMNTCVHIKRMYQY
jgi:hypothetical protein